MNSTASRLLIIFLLCASLVAPFSLTPGENAPASAGPEEDGGPARAPGGGTRENNDPPYVLEDAPTSFTVPEDGAPQYLFLALIFGDPDLDPLTYTILDTGYGSSYNDGLIEASIMTNNDTLKVKSKPDKNGEVVVTLRATDVVLNHTEHDVNIVVTPTNDAPYFSSIGGEPVIPGETFLIDVDEDEKVELVVEAVDIDGDVLKFTDDSRLFNIKSSGDQTALIKFTPRNEDVDLYDFELGVDDERGKDRVLAVELTVHNTNDPPAWTKIDGDDVREGILYTFTVWQNQWINITTKAQDDDKKTADEKLTFTCDLPWDDFIDPETGVIAFKTGNEHVGAHLGTLTVTDRSGETDTLDIKVIVSDVNDPPSKPIIQTPDNGANIEMGPEGVKFIAGLVSDPDEADVLTYRWEFGDGGEDSGKTARHVYRHSGMFNVTLSVDDGSVAKPVSTTIRIYVERNETLWDNDGDTIPDSLDDDDDNDGMLDQWELGHPAYGLDPMNASDALADLDEDGYTNLEEYEEGTDLADAADNPAAREKAEREKAAQAEALNPAVLVAAGVAAAVVFIIVLLVIMTRMSARKAKEEQAARAMEAHERSEKESLDEIHKLYGGAGPPGGGPGGAGGWGGAGFGGGPGRGGGPGGGPGAPGAGPGAPGAGPGAPGGGGAYRPGGPAGPAGGGGRPGVPGGPGDGALGGGPRGKLPPGKA